MPQHLDVVAALVAPYGADDQVVAYLHDVLEDTDETREEVAHVFGEEIARHTQLVTDESGHNRRERKERTNEKLAAVQESDFRALRVKAADRLANLRAAAKSKPKLLQMYQKEHAAFRTAVYRKGLVEELWAEMDVIVAIGIK